MHSHLVPTLPLPSRMGRLMGQKLSHLQPSIFTAFSNTHFICRQRRIWTIIILSPTFPCYYQIDGGGKWVEKIIQHEGQKNRREREGGWRCQKTRGFWVARFRVSKMQCGYINLGVYQLLKSKLCSHCIEVFSSQSKLFSTPAHLCVPFWLSWHWGDWLFIRPLNLPS